MNPRLIGALLVLAAIAATISVPAVLGRRTAGTAVMVELPRDPRVGDCVVTLPAEFFAEPADAPTATSLASTDSVGPLGLSFGSCDEGPVAGEVVALTSAVTDRTTGQLQAPTGLDCRAAALSYAGLVPVDGRFMLPNPPPNDPVAWNFSINVRSSWVLPSPLLQAQQRNWAACLVAPRDNAQYTGRILSAFNGGVLPDEFGTCWNSRSVSASVERVDCRAPHLAELVSAGFVVDRSTITADDLRASCERLAARVVGRTDPTAGARLVVKTSPETLGTNQESRSVSVLCYLVTPGRPLDATLVGLRDQPLPYAG